MVLHRIEEVKLSVLILVLYKKLVIYIFNKEIFFFYITDMIQVEKLSIEITWALLFLCLLCIYTCIYTTMYFIARVYYAAFTMYFIGRVCLLCIYTTMYFIGRVTLFFDNNYLTEYRIAMEFLHNFLKTLP